MLSPREILKNREATEWFAIDNDGNAHPITPIAPGEGRPAFGNQGLHNAVMAVAAKTGKTCRLAMRTQDSIWPVLDLY